MVADAGDYVYVARIDPTFSSTPEGTVTRRSDDARAFVVVVVPFPSPPLRWEIILPDRLPPMDPCEEEISVGHHLRDPSFAG